MASFFLTVGFFAFNLYLTTAQPGVIGMPPPACKTDQDCQNANIDTPVCVTGGMCSAGLGMNCGMAGPQPVFPNTGAGSYIPCSIPYAMCNFGNNRNPQVSLGKCQCMNGYEEDAGGCKRIRRKLQESCTDDVECFAAYSGCQSGSCKCLPGFKPDGDETCVPEKYNCAFGEAKKEGGQVVFCEIDHATDLMFPNKRPCGEGFRCMTHEGFSFTPVERGHCCPEATFTCPVGAPHPTATCGFMTGPNVEYCPMTHQCISGPNANPGEGLCCPKACSSYDDVYVNMKCLPVATRIGEACVDDSQCVRMNATCSAAGACLCTGETIDVHGFCTVPTCFNYMNPQPVGFGPPPPPQQSPKPKKDANGRYIQCDPFPMNPAAETSDVCGSSHYCESPGFCCPAPTGPPQPCPVGYQAIGGSSCSTFGRVKACDFSAATNTYPICSGTPGLCCEPAYQPPPSNNWGGWDNSGNSWSQGTANGGWNRRR